MFRTAFLRLSNAVVDWSGRPSAFAIALAMVLIWAVTGPMFGFSETWQLVINTGTTIVTFLMVFLLQNAQNRDSRAIQTKLNELIYATDSDNRFIGVENLDDEDLRRLSDRLLRLAEMKQATDRARRSTPRKQAPNRSKPMEVGPGGPEQTPAPKDLNSTQ